MFGYGAIWEWLIFFGVIYALIYTMFVIKNEKNTFLETAVLRSFKHFDLLIPSWWTQTLDEENAIAFERTDTRYDWKATFTWLQFTEKDLELSLEDKFKELIQDRKILFDLDTGAILNPSDFLSHPASQKEGISMLRIEGTASEDEVDRVYFDAFILKDEQAQGYLFCESRSSVLNGLVEGPYFEEVIMRVIAK